MDIRTEVAPPSPQPIGRPEPHGLWGWLILPLIGLCLTPFLLAFSIYQLVLILEPSTWNVLTTPGTSAYHPIYKVLIPAEMVVNFAMLGFTLLLVVLFFRKDPRLPKLMVAFYLINLVIIVGDTFAASFIPSFSFDRDVIRDVVRTVIAAVIWVPYFLVSQRVKNTFRRDAPGA